ncbi:M23 family metallopeptidase [Novosphingobium album (ex Liu et al. 2023)]|uniref:M23 family metallopeptidase n=1 Tax=Novosphingobium album (ex Liu et al. 2023) TaxID=3031130 RepID=A0ABT5WP47_9SPHN|nr:M23 family metallopeptidase [Novosphingobium album (ex Liu et al. 2023)]MDE8651810.1 M23 family metallopeptidase [Novosphingobium album (ex Liu et al. 2023)]
MTGKSVGAFGARLRTTFPDREFFMRSQGQVRFIRISSRFQIVAVSLLAALLLAWLVTMAALTVLQYSATRERMALVDREAKVASAESRVSEYRDGLDSVAADLARRQNFIEKMVEAHIGDLPEDARQGETVSDSSTEAARTVRKVSAVLPEAVGLARIEADQLAFVERLTRFADRRAAKTSEAIRRLGLNPNMLLASANAAEGGPLLRLATGRDGSLDPRFQRLGVSLARMDALERSLAGIPQVQPAHVAYVSSSYGYRADPFTGAAAFHAGLDFPGPMGSPIYAAAKGVVSFVGTRQGYGNCIEIDHGNGLMTRYAHLSRFGTHVGAKIAAGTAIAAMGSTGRSTGPHLHFEVRINDTPVNPRPFLEAARNVQQEADNDG